MHVEMARTLRVLAVNGDPRTIRNEDETFFFETALRSGIPGALVVSKLADDVSAEGLGAYTVVALLNVAQPTQPLAQALEHFVEAGGGLFVSVGDRVDTAVWNQRMAKLLPQPLGLARTAAALPGQHAGETVDERPAERLLPLDRRAPLLAAFADQGDSLLSARFFKYTLLDPVRDTALRNVILRFESGAPALVERDVGKGRVMLLTTTVDREWTDLPIRPGFLPLLRETARHLVGAADEESAAASLVGEPRLLSFAGDVQILEVTRPDGSVWVGRREQAGPAAPCLCRHRSDRPLPCSRCGRGWNLRRAAAARTSRSISIRANRIPRDSRRRSGPIAWRPRARAASAQAPGRAVARPLGALAS